MILAIDFDGVIHNSKQPLEGKSMGAPIMGNGSINSKGALDGMRYLKDQGHTLIVYTVRGKQQYVADWLAYYQIPYDELTSEKPNAHVYLDDRALRFTSWDAALNQIEALDAV